MYGRELRFKHFKYLEERWKLRRDVQWYRYFEIAHGAVEKNVKLLKRNLFEFNFYLPAIHSNRNTCLIKGSSYPLPPAPFINKTRAIVYLEAFHSYWKHVSSASMRAIYFPSKSRPKLWTRGTKNYITNIPFAPSW